MACAMGVEPPLADLESAVLPLNDAHVAGEAGLEPAMRGPKPRALPLGDSPVKGVSLKNPKMCE